MLARSLRPRVGLAVFALVALATLALSSACTKEVAAELKTYTGINEIRAQHGLPPLTPDRALVDIARLRSSDMATKNYFGHTPPDGCNYVCLMDRYGVPHAYAGENIAWNTWDWQQTADVAINMWANSPPHLENILNCHYERVGSGVVQAADGKIYFTMIFEGNRPC